MGLRDAYIICKAEIDTIEDYRKKLTNSLKTVNHDEQKSTENDIHNQGKKIIDSLMTVKHDEQSSTKNDIDDSKEKDFDDIFISFCSYVKKVFSNMTYIYGGLYYLIEFLDDGDDSDGDAVSNKTQNSDDIATSILNRLLESSRRDKHKRMGEFENFYVRVQCIISLYESIYKQNEESIGLDIKIPGTDSITELKKYIDSLEFVLTKCPFIQSNEESLKLRAVDNGSIWLIFGVAGVAGVSAVVVSKLMNDIVEFVKKCIELKKYLLEYKKQEQLLKRSDLEQKEQEEIFKSINKLYTIAVKNAIKEMEDSTGHHLQDGDEQGRAEQSFERMVKLLDKGVQIHSAINAPEEVKELFEPLEKLYIEIGKKLDRIEEKLGIDTE